MLAKKILACSNHSEINRSCKNPVLVLTLSNQSAFILLLTSLVKRLVVAFSVGRGRPGVLGLVHPFFV